MTARGLVWLWLSCSLALNGCGHKTQGTAEPVSAGGGVSRGTTAANPRDAATKPATTEDDAGSSPSPAMAFRADECRTVPATSVAGADLGSGELVNGTSDPADFVVTRVVATWDTDCSQPTVVITLSDGTCPYSHGHDLVLRLGASAIADGSIHLGQNTIVPDPDADHVSIRYTRPKRMQPSGTWGTCSSASGTLDLIGDLDTTVNTTLQGRFELELTACDGSTNQPETVSGTFNVTLHRGLKEACP